MAPRKDKIEEVADRDDDDPLEPGPLERLGHRVQRWKARAPQQGAVFRLVFAAALGLCTGYGALFFRQLIHSLTRLAYPADMALSKLRALPWWRKVLPPTVGGAIVGPAVRLLAPEAKGHGVPEVKDACENLGGRIRTRVAVVKTLASGITIGSGGSVGREGPIVQIGSSLGSAFGRLIGLRGRGLVDFVAAGAAAGIAATFNAPIAGVVFAIEIILGRGSPRHFSPLVVASVAATVITHLHLGKSPAFVVPAYALVSGWELLLYVVLGVLAGLVGVAFTRSLYLLEDVWERLPLVYIHGAVGGLIVGTTALWFPEVLGVGYALIEGVLGVGEQMALTLPAMEAHLLLLVVFKLFATGTTIASGGSGGVFAPSLFLGASLGGAFGGAASRLTPSGAMASPSAYALVAMGGVVGATTHAPLTAIVIVFELCDRHSIILPLMLVTVIATALSMALHRQSIYTEKLVRRGSGRGAQGSPAERVRATRVGDVMQPTAAWVKPSARLETIVNRAHAHDTHDVYVVDHRQVLGVVSMDDIASHVQDRPAQRRRLRASTLMHAVATVTAETSLADCMVALQERHREELPVVDQRMRLIGSISRGDLLAYTSREVLRHEAVLDLMADGDPAHAEIALAAGEIQASIDVGGELVGKSLRELDLRTRLSINVYALCEGDRVVMPDANAPLRKGQQLRVVGHPPEIEHLRELALG
jgi:CIC family chloride channel protein